MTTKLSKPVPPPPFATERMERSDWSFKRTGSGYDMPMAGEYLPAWKRILKDHHWPTTVVLYDFETYFDQHYNMRKADTSTIEYIMDDRFEITALATLQVHEQHNFPDYERQTRTVLGEGTVRDHIAYLQRQYGQNLERCTLVAQNAVFDGAILSYRFDIHPPHCIDILGLARHWNSRDKNDLDTLCKRYGLPYKGDTGEFKGATFRKHRVSRNRGGTGSKKSRRPVKVEPMSEELAVRLQMYAGNDVMREWELFTLLLPKMSLPHQEIDVNQHTLDLYWKPTFVVDEDKGEELKTAIEAEIDKAVDRVGVSRGEISGETSFEELLESALVAADEDPRNYQKAAKNKKGWKFAIAKDDPERELLENHEDGVVRDLMAAKAAVSAWPNHISRIDRIIRQARAAGGRLPVPLKYHGAHTGRWSGAEKINLQNLGSRGHDLVNAIRTMLLAPPGHELVIADASQIEARVLAWMAGQWDLVEKFANDEEIYCGFAERVLGYPVRKPKKSGGIERIEKRMKWARNSVGKVGILGCGYGMGADKAIGYAGGAITPAIAEKLVEQYREENPQVKQFWKDIEKAFVYTVKYQRDCEMRCGVRFTTRPDCDVVMVLPNGREIKYAKVRVKAGKWGEEISVYNEMTKSWGHIWGGALTENVVQATSRDILWGAVWGMETAGYPVVHHVHDELIACVPEGAGETALKHTIDLLSTRPEWARDCPLAAEGVVTSRYGSH